MARITFGLPCVFAVAVAVAPPAVVPPAVLPATSVSSAVTSVSQPYVQAAAAAPVRVIDTPPQLGGYLRSAAPTVSMGETHTNLPVLPNGLGVEALPLHASKPSVPSWTASLGASLLAALATVAGVHWWRGRARARKQLATEMIAFDSATAAPNIAWQPPPATRFAVAATAGERKGLFDPLGLNGRLGSQRCQLQAEIMHGRLTSLEALRPVLSKVDHRRNLSRVVPFTAAAAVAAPAFAETLDVDSSIALAGTIEPMMLGIVSGVVPITVLGLFVAAWLQFKKSPTLGV